MKTYKVKEIQITKITSTIIYDCNDELSIAPEIIKFDVSGVINYYLWDNNVKIDALLCSYTTGRFILLKEEYSKSTNEDIKNLALHCIYQEMYMNTLELYRSAIYESIIQNVNIDMGKIKVHSYTIKTNGIDNDITVDLVGKMWVHIGNKSKLETIKTTYVTSVTALSKIDEVNEIELVSFIKKTYVKYSK